MSAEIPVLVFIAVAAFLARRLRGGAGRRVAMAYGVGVLLSMGGCGGALAWLGAETSGNKNLLHQVHPYVWSMLFGVGLTTVVGTSVGVLVLRARSSTGSGSQPEPRRPTTREH